MTQIGPEGETTETTAIDPPVRIVAKPPEGDLEAIGRYYRPYYELAEHALLAGLTPSELEAVAVLRDGVTFVDLTRRLKEAKEGARFGFEHVAQAWASAFESLVGIREDAVRGFAQKLKKAHFDNRNVRRG
ncbi:MAG: hypothetical protein A2186_04140 [Candidatus Levybacteria bacterium RIFOXYA1_FULL_41_10]|nr:MAG: hypothetical protein UT46_C0004G0006 [Candidatus Levybacteria bacterium GW2011_GWA1_39_34]KKR51261.1 MAG: hypothetical protein UT87_C0007G0021 [Candidatus Levybacteria bacterium GW2011_GWC1_40_19]KKR73856.1 MAG: hypothetical protein UU15_C0001G0031 [Candidatus Levybacteria bacterium GW2011_GWC2_40_7]KKR94651.1 MAG: hypothetical protein UU45_C0008G0051 [Candidatus Levybacteria bacterium GW2011_GWA2_41_15]KKS02028.1 MAG: hypothetical protein UU52_C0004G0006 [Candidatus Levybacteria bacter